jgi:hypothetical protein
MWIFHWVGKKKMNSHNIIRRHTGPIPALGIVLSSA